MKTQAETAPPSPADARDFFANKMSFTTGPVELNHRIEQRDDIVIVDVREAEDFQRGHIPGAINLPQADWNTLKGLSKDTVNILCYYSAVCHLAAKAAVQFAIHGYSVMEMDGGFEVWKQNELPVEI